MSKAMEGIGTIKKLSKTIIRHSLITIHKSLGDLSYGAIMFNQIMKVLIKKRKNSI